ncbi:oxygenase MpaB family protein [Sinomonas sp. ASV322]|uniref:oxygenase MpaB family protein n=1 Tax=Sinomonas sp. ASV322 TaxID=3041920 RepID=UPI0027DE0C44|nr:oxygenase MpaB family protein [Sinomonas sp. ASV322]MDQ4502919.1 oxygenase MpaB family protein [Sinomonas sp. ASV322]
MSNGVLEPLRRRLSLTFAGQSEGIPAWELALEDGDDAGYFAPDSVTWRVHGGMTTIVGGIRALLTQALHPGVLAGVLDHSYYQDDPLARLARTIRWVFTVTFGDTRAARTACEHVRRRHAPVVGRYVDGRGVERDYSANDPELLEWVHIAFTDAFLGAYEYVRCPLPPARADQYVREWAVAGELMGVESPPRSVAALRERLEAYDDGARLAHSPRLDEVVGFLRKLPLDPMLVPGYRTLFAAAVDSMPHRYTDLLGLDRSSLGRGLLPPKPAASVTLAVVGLALGNPGPSEQAARRRLARLGVL